MGTVLNALMARKHRQVRKSRKGPGDRASHVRPDAHVGGLELLEDRRLMANAAPGITIDYPRDTPPLGERPIVMTDHENDPLGPKFHFNVFDASGLTSVTATLTLDSGSGPVTVYEQTNAVSGPTFFSPDIFTNQYGIGRFRLTVSATDRPPAGEVQMTSTASQDLIVVDNDTTPPSAEFTRPRIDPITDADN